MNPKEMFFEISNSEVQLWIEQGQSLCIKAISKDLDPVDLSCNEAKKIGRALLNMVKMIEKRESNVS